MGFPTVTYTFSNASTADATQVNQNFTDLINGVSDGTKNINISAATMAGAVVCNGAVTLGASTANLIVFNGSINSSVPINTNTTYDIGAATLGVRSVYIGGSSTFTVRLLGGTQGSSYTLTLPTTAGTANQFLQTNGSGVTTWASTAPTVSVCTLSGHSGGFSANATGNYTTPANVLYIRLRMVGGGGGGGGGGTGAQLQATTGGTTTFGTSNCTGGIGGYINSAGALGGTPTLGSGYTGISLAGGQGQSGGEEVVSNQSYNPGGQGGSGPFGGGGSGGVQNAVGADGTANTGSGGGGGGYNSGAGSTFSGCGGGAGAYIDCIFVPTAGQVIAYTVGAVGTKSSGVTSGQNGGNGAGGIIEITEYYQ